MNPLDDILINGLLRTDENGKVLQKEDNKVEFKRIFDNNSKEAKAKYSKELAALYNYEGGYLIFGVDDSTNDLLGLNEFDDIDNAELANDINTYFSPAITFQSKSMMINEKKVFVIYVEKRTSIPTVCIKAHQNAVSEGIIYWRYSAQSAPIKSGDLIDLMHSLRGEETERLADIAEKEYRSKHRPKLWLNGVSLNGNEVAFSIENDGPPAILDGFEFIEKNVDQLYAPTWKNWAHKKGELLKIPITGSSKHHQELSFKMEIKYHDEEGHVYKSILIYENKKSKLSDPIPSN